VNVIGVMALVENAVSENSQRPDDVVVSMSGQTIDIRNTDAEGRLILADALTYVQRFYNPALIVDLATLTGAMSIALGSNIYAGLFSNNDELQKKLRDSGEKTGERLWRMPLGPQYNKKMDSKIADMQNISNTKGFGGGSITAAEFLQRFIENKTAWAHLDIANVDNFGSDTESSFYGSCGFGVRLLNEFSKNYES
jgi:leucyl aminopeptidase